MRSYSRKRKNNIIIGSLCGILLLMVVGYSVFSSRLNIKGTSGISSNWDIEITNIRAGNPAGGDAYDINEPTYTPSTATFNTGLKTPGTNRVYEVEISNKGTIDGLVTIASLTVGNNDAIGFTVSEYKEKAYNDSFTSLNKTADLNIENGTNDYKDIKFYLKSTEKHYLYVTVEYKDVTTQPDNLDTNINLELNYEQAGLDENGVAIPAQTYTVNYTKEDDITSIGSNEASCEITGGANTTCEITLPTIELTKDGYMPIWIDENGKEVGEPNNKYEVSKNQTLIASSKPLPAIIKSWDSNPNTDFHTTAYKESIITAEFVDNIDVPDNAVESFDVSADSTKGKVIAWVIADEADSTKHHLYIGGKGGVVANQNSSSLFYNFKNLQTITFGNNFDTLNVTNMRSMFDGCSSLTTLDVSNFDTSNVMIMSDMFSSCSSLTTLDLSNFDTSNVIDMSSMFYNCSNLTSLDVSNFDTSKVTRMDFMFNGCSNLTALDVSNFNTRNVTYMEAMFSNCSSLTTLDVSNFDTSKVTKFGWQYGNSGMFAFCTNLTKLNLCSFDTSSATDARNVFNNTPKLTQIYVSDKWNMDNADVTDMFKNSASTSVIQSNNCMIDAGTSEITPQSSNEEVATISAKAVANEAKYNLRKVFA